MVPLAVLGVRVAMEPRALPRTIAEHIVTTGELGVRAAAEEMEARVATPQK